MSYVLNSPIDVSDANPVSILLTDTTSLETWSIETTGTSSLLVGCTTTPDSLEISNLGAAKMRNLSTLQTTLRTALGTGTVNLKPSPAMVGNYDIQFPSSAPVANQVLMYTGSSYVYQNFFNTVTNVVVVRKLPNPGEFSSIAAAVASISGATDTNRVAVHVYPGDYNEPAIVLPSYVFIVGESMEACRVFPSGLGYSLFKLSKRSGLVFLTLKDNDPLFPVIDATDCNDYSLIHKIEIEGCARGILCGASPAAIEDCWFYAEYTGFTDATTYSLYAQDLSGTFKSWVSLENYFVNNHSDDAVIAEGALTEVAMQASEFEGDGNGRCIRVTLGGKVDVRAIYIDAFATGIQADNDVGSPILLLSSILFEDCTSNIDIRSATASGHFDGYSEYLKTMINPANSFFVSNKDRKIITISAKGADFSSVKDAVDSITDNGPTNQYTVYVGPGVYVELPIILKPFITILGFSQTQTIIIAADPSGALITGCSYASVQNLMVMGAGGPGGRLLEYLGDAFNAHFRCQDVAFHTAETLMNVGSSGGPSILMVLNPVIYGSQPFVNGFVIQDDGISTISFVIDGLIWNPDASGLALFSQLVHVKSIAPGPFPGVQGTVSDFLAGQGGLSPVGTGVVVEGSSYVAIDSSLFGGFLTGVLVPASGVPTTLIITSSTFGNCTVDIQIDNAITVGSINCNAGIAKVLVNPAATIGVAITDPTGAGVAFSGQIYQGTTVPQITNITGQIQRASCVGYIDDLPTLTSTGLNVDVPAGKGYLMIGTGPTEYLKYRTWSAATIAVPDNVLSWIYVNGAGTVTSATSQPDHVQSVILSTVKTYGGAVTYFQDIGWEINHLPSQLDETFRLSLGPIFNSGCIATPGSSGMKISVSSGSYAYSIHQYEPTATTDISMTAYYGGTTETTIPDIPLPPKYDNAGVLTNIPVAQWVKHALYMISSDLNVPQYFLVYGQELFATELLAQGGNLPIPPTSFFGNMVPVSGVIITDSDVTIPSTRFRDIRPTLAFKATGFTASADHNSLLNLTVGNAHPQYLRVDGTSSMTADLNVGGNNITNVNLVDGVDVPSHESRHIPGGADPLPTAPPITISTANLEGIAVSFSRSDHQHSHGAQTNPAQHAVVTAGANGFMINTDKVKLDAATAANTASTIMMRSASKATNISQVNLDNGTTANFVAIKPSTVAFASDFTMNVPVANDTFAALDTLQSFTNKTISGATNTVEATALRTTTGAVTVNTAVTPVAGQVLTATSGTAAAWSSASTQKDYSINNVAVSASATVATTFSYFLWDNAIFSPFTTRTVALWIVPSPNRGLNLDVFDGAVQRGTLVVPAASATGRYSFTFTSPGSDASFQLRASKSAVGGTNPMIFGCTFELA